MDDDSKSSCTSSFVGRRPPPAMRVVRHRISRNILSECVAWFKPHRDGTLAAELGESHTRQREIVEYNGLLLRDGYLAEGDRGEDPRG